MGISKGLSWSFTRHRSLGGCPRAHWFSYYAEGEPEALQAKLLKQLVTHEMLAGQVVDWQVNRALDFVRQGKEEPVDLIDVGLSTLVRLLEKSEWYAGELKRGRALPWGAQPLISDYYDLPPDPQRVAQCQSRVELSLEGLYGSGVWETLKRTSPSRWGPEREGWDISAEEWRLGDVPIWSAVDMWLDFKERGLVILDWKSGVHSDHQEVFQLATYSLWAQTTRGLDREQVLVQAVHLPLAPDWSVKPISRVSCDIARETILAEHTAELALLPPPKDINGVLTYEVDRKVFSPRPQKDACLRCKFRAICPEGQNEVYDRVNQ
ncbi:MAG: PD-(D/E)XK nuclease family protein [Fimbriimonadaceae bacterium]|nr:PD-(D/E)XK nuclease family protein [Fimbriimonadaceae bacterium]